MSPLTAIWRHLRDRISFIVIITIRLFFLCSNIVALLSFPQLAMVLWLGNALTVRVILLCQGLPGWKDVVELVLLQPRLHVFLKLRSQRRSISGFFAILCAYPLKGDVGEFHCCPENCAFFQVFRLPLRIVIPAVQHTSLSKLGTCFFITASRQTLDPSRKLPLERSPGFFRRTWKWLEVETTSTC